MSTSVTAALEALSAAERDLLRKIHNRGPKDAARQLGGQSDEAIGRILNAHNPGEAGDILMQFPAERRPRIAAATPFGRGEQWLAAQQYKRGSVGRLMERPLAVFRPTTTVREAVDELRGLVKKAFITYGFITEPDARLVGVLAFRELLFARPDQPISDIMVPNPFSLRPEETLVEAMKEVVTRHFPAYPVCDEAGRLLGMVRGQMLFEKQAFEISAQAGAMVGVEKEERVTTTWPRSLKSRHPWLQLNLLTAFVAAAVVGFFQETVDQIVVLAMFLPVLAGQSGNTGCQALAVTLRGMTLGDLKPSYVTKLVLKEALLGTLNGLGTGLIAGIGMYVVARSQGNPNAMTLALCVMAAMIISCAISGISGALIPLTMKKMGADPATASSIFLTTATDVASMSALLGLATLLLVK